MRFLSLVVYIFILFAFLISCEHHHQPSTPDDPSFNSYDANSMIPIDSAYGLKIEICRWKQNKRAAYSITFDDVRSSHYLISAPELNQRQMVGTFFLNTKSITNWLPWQTLANQGHELASHTYSHPKCPELTEEALRFELSKAKKDILSNIHGIEDVPSFAFPYGLSNLFAREIVMEYHESARGSWGINNAILTKDDFSLLKYIGVYPPYDTVYVYDKIIKAIQGGKWVIFAFHSVSAEEISDETTMPLSLFKQHLDYVQQNIDSLWIATHGQVVSYIKVRQSATLSTSLLHNKMIEITLMDSCGFYDARKEISYQLEVPLSWRGKKLVRQRENSSTSESLKTRNNKIVDEICVGSTIRIFCVNE